MSSVTLVALKGNANTTYCDLDGNPHRTDETGIVYAPSARQSELTTRHASLATASAGDLRAAGKGAYATSYKTNSPVDHG